MRIGQGEIYKLEYNCGLSDLLSKSKDKAKLHKHSTYLGGSKWSIYPKSQA